MKKVCKQGALYLVLLIVILMFTSCGRTLPNGEYKGLGGDKWTVKGDTITVLHPGVYDLETGLEYKEFKHKIKDDEIILRFNNGPEVPYSFEKQSGNSYLIDGKLYTRQ